MSGDDARQILWVSHLVPYPPKGGALQRSFNLLRETARYHTVDLLAFIQRPYLRYLAEDDTTALAMAREALEKFCRTVRFLPLPEATSLTGRPGLLASSLVRTKPYTVNWLASRRMAACIDDQVSRHRYDAAHLDTISLLEYQEALRGIPVLLNHHNIESQMMLRRADNERNPLRRFYMWQEGHKIQRYERHHAGSAALHITCSALDSERLLAIAPELDGKVAEVPNGVDLEFFQPSTEDTDGARIIFAGRLGAYTNRQAALYIAREIWPRLRAQRRDIALDIVGANPPAELLQLAAADPDVRVPGFVDDVRPWLARASVYACPITDGGGTKLKVLDALAMGKAMVAHPIACEGIAVEDGVHVALARNPDQFVRTITDLLDDPTRREQMGRAARRLVEERYSYSAIGRELADHYRRISSS